MVKKLNVKSKYNIKNAQYLSIKLRFDKIN